VQTADISTSDTSALRRRPMDLVFPALHGIFGEDGQVQRLMESHGLPYVGSGPAASEIAMDKARTKQKLLSAGIPTPAWRVAHAAAPEAWRSLSAEIGFPQVIKPVSGGSSVDCRICRSESEAMATIEKSVHANGSMLIETCIRGPEITVGILDGEALPVIQVRPAADFYDYQAKYKRDDTQYLFDINLPEKCLNAARGAALKCHRIIGARHLSRVDIMIDAGTLEPMVLEINTMPGFTSHSLVPKAAAQAGMSFETLCERLCRMALREGLIHNVAVEG
jgi:D-alanine-D-alanine ligase